MVFDELLRSKYDVQRQLDAEAGQDLGRYVERLHQLVEEVEAEYGVTFKYGKIGGQRVEAGVDATKTA